MKPTKTGNASIFYAHSVDEDPDKSTWQPLVDHLTSVGKLAAEFAHVFGAGPLAAVAGLLHDLGKYTDEFQKRLEGGPKVDHATWGARKVKQLYPKAWPLLAYGIAGHHAGLANGTNGNTRTALDDRLRATLPELLPHWQWELPLPDSSMLSLPPQFTPIQERIRFQQTVLARMIFSCLVDADFIDTDEFYRRNKGDPPRTQGPQPTLHQLRERLETELEAKLSGPHADSNVNRLRAEILANVRGNAELPPGLFSLTVPTGGGKTLTSLAFALDHAIAYGLQRVIYVIPFTSIVEQNAQVFRNAFADLGEAAVLEHHSAFIDDTKTAYESREKRRLAMENWDAPVVVTTAVQFFESLFADRPSRCRKLHHIAGSVVVVDEAQTMPLNLLRASVAILDELALNYRTSVVLCTATQPALLDADGFRDGLKNVRELAPQPPKLYEKLRQVMVRHIGELSDEALADELCQREQVLCIVNNRRHARAAYDAIKDQAGAMHLSTLMCAEHRKQVLTEVRRRLREAEPCRLVSTSLIEAGVDVDFPRVLRAEAGLDSIAQAAGRCNREGRKPISESETRVFATANPDWKPPRELVQYAQVFREILRHHGDDLLSPEAVRAYFKALYWQQGDDRLDAHDLLGLLRQSSPDSLPFETLASRFRMIESAMYPIIIPFDDEVSKIVADLEFAPSVARRLQPYLVQAPRQAYDALRLVGAIQPVAPERYGEQFMQLVEPASYDDNYGLHWDDPGFRPADANIW